MNKLTHSQASVLRAVNEHTVIYIGHPVMGDFDASSLIEDYGGNNIAELKQLGHEVLNDYDNEHQIINTKTHISIPLEEYTELIKYTIDDEYELSVEKFNYYFDQYILAKKLIREAKCEI